MWGVPLFVATLLVGLLVSAPVVKIFLLLAIIGTTFAAFYTFKSNRRKAEKIDPMVPTGITYIGVYFGLAPYFNPYGVAGLLFGIFLLMSGSILEQDRKDREPMQQISTWAGIAFVILSLIWIALAQMQLDDNLIRSFHNELERIDPVEYVEATIDASAANLPKEGDWIFTWYNADNNPFRYHNVKAEISGSKLSFIAKWTDNGESGTTEMELFRSDCISCYTGDIAVSEAASVPFSQGNVSLQKKREGCLTGRAFLAGNNFLVKVYKMGVRCSV